MRACFEGRSAGSSASSLALVGTMMVGCGTSSSPRTDAGAPRCAPYDLLVGASDESTDSDLGLLSLDGGASFSPGAGSLGYDPAVASSQGRVFWIDRHAGNVLEIDPRCGTILDGPWSTSDPDAASTNPQDIAVDPSTGNLWIARFQVPTILVKSSDGATDLGRIDLSSVANVDRNPFMSSIRIIDLGSGPKAYVTLEMLNAEFQSVDPSYIVRLDVATALLTGKVEAALQLKGRNPFGLMVEYEQKIYLADPGSFTDATETDAGVEVVDLASFTSNLLVRESDIGASVDQVSVGDACGTAIVAGADADNTTSLISFSLSTGAQVTPLSAKFLTTAAGFKLGGMAWLEGGLEVVGDGTGVAGKGYAVDVVQVSSACSLTETSRALYAPLPPIALVPVP